MIVLEHPSAPPGRRATSTPEQRLLLHNVSWDTYETVCDLLAPTGVRLTYAAGDLELMSPSRRHERAGFVVGRMIDIIADELDLRVEPGQSTTLRHPAVKRGSEGDQCFWVQHEEAVRDREEIDLTRDPPPDLFIEIEVSHSLIDRLEVCAALRIPEVWRLSGTSVRIFRLRDSGQYAETSRSEVFPQIEVAAIGAFLAQGKDKDYVSTMRRFREWVRDQIQREHGGPS